MPGRASRASGCDPTPLATTCCRDGAIRPLPSSNPIIRIPHASRQGTGVLRHAAGGRADADRTGRAPAGGDGALDAASVGPSVPGQIPRHVHGRGADIHPLHLLFLHQAQARGPGRSPRAATVAPSATRLARGRRQRRVRSYAARRVRRHPGVRPRPQRRAAPPSSSASSWTGSRPIWCSPQPALPPRPRPAVRRAHAGPAGRPSAVRS